MARAARHLAWLLLVAVAALAGCGGGSDDDLTKGLSAQEILDKSRETAAQVTTYHPHLELDLDLTATTGAAGLLPRLAGTPVTIVADGPVRRPIAEGGAAFDFDTTAKIGPLTLSGQLTKVEDAVYVTVGGKAFKLPLTAEQAQAVGIPPEPALFISDPQQVGQEQINGVPTVHLRGAVATDAVVDYVAGVLGTSGLLSGGAAPSNEQIAGIKEQLRGAVSQSSSDVWIGTNDLLPHRVAATIALKGPVDALPGVLSATLNVRADVSGFNDPVTIEAPPNAIPFSLNALLPGLSGLGF
jgi:hypothetical protein